MNGALGIVGVGGLAEFVVEGFRHAGDRRRILLSPRGAERAADLARRFACEVMPTNQAVLDAADMVIVATLPNAVIDCLRALRWRPRQLLICVAIDVSLPALEAAAPGAAVVRAMPSSAAAFGASAMPIYPDHAGARALLAALGTVLPVPDERAFDAGSAYAGYYLWVYALLDEMTLAGERAGLPRAAAIGLAAGLAKSAAEHALRADPAHPVREPLDRHGTPGTMTAGGMAILDAADAFRPWRQAYEGAVARLRGAAAAKS
jgi:pyrroline-5-carboxylate reductase